MTDDKRWNEIRDEENYWHQRENNDALRECLKEENKKLRDSLTKYESNLIFAIRSIRWPLWFIFWFMCFKNAGLIGCDCCDDHKREFIYHVLTIETKMYEAQQKLNECRADLRQIAVDL